MNQAGLFLPVPVFGQNRAKMAYFQTQGRGGQTHSNLKINIFFWFPTENYNRNHPLIRELVLVPPPTLREMYQVWFVIVRLHLKLRLNNSIFLVGVTSEGGKCLSAKVMFTTCRILNIPNGVDLGKSLVWA